MNDLSEDLKDQIPIINVDRFSPINQDAFMKCKKIIRVIEKGIKYKITKTDLIQTNLPLTEKKKIKIIKPEGLKIFNADILDKIKEDLSYNIFGKNNYLILDQDNLTIPVIDSTENNFNYFGALLHHIDDVIEINTPNPVFLTQTNVGIHYMKDYILQPNLGDGFFIKKHDNFHFHSPLNHNCKGFLVLAKQIKENQFEIAAIKIPFKKCVITPSNVFHSDCSLVGDFLVAYGITKNYLTLNLFNKKNEIIKINFE